jgi:3-hydroxyacyl-[acyl-carrier-protein] dehydratase
MELDGITRRIPHRPPFLWIDRVREISGGSIVAEKEIDADLDIFQGHYPEYPIMPGVLLCESVFQAGALLIGELIADEGNGMVNDGIPVLTRINGAKFKREIFPGDRIEIRAELKERVGTAWFLKGSVRCEGKVALTVEFACALRESQPQN